MPRRVSPWVRELSRLIKSDGSNIQDIRKQIIDGFGTPASRQTGLSNCKTEYENNNKPTQEFLVAAAKLCQRLVEGDLMNMKGATKVFEVLRDVIELPCDQKIHRALANMYNSWCCKPSKDLETVDAEIINAVIKLPQPWPVVKCLVLSKESKDGMLSEVQERSMYFAKKRSQQGAGVPGVQEEEEEDNSLPALRVASAEQAAKIVQEFRALLQSDLQPPVMVFAVMFLSGRRMADLVNGKFTAIQDKPDYAHFSQGSKQRGVWASSMDIPLLLPLEELNSMIAKVSAFLQSFPGEGPADKTDSFRRSKNGREGFMQFKETMLKILRDVLDGRPLNCFTPHKLRHLYAAALPFLQPHQGYSAGFVSQALGHSSLLATKPYLGNYAPTKKQRTE